MRKARMEKDGKKWTPIGGVAIKGKDVNGTVGSKVQKWAGN
jgi:hypothetical protein